MRPPGTLSVVATPIGNLEDLTFRALRTLREADLIAAEDTRRTSKLLAHYEVSKPLVSLHEHNEYREAASIVGRLAGGENVALVSDAGTPAISDPGAHLVRMAREAGIRVIPIPGPSAITAALSVSGLALDGFVFLGFPPSSGAGRKVWLESLGSERRTAIFFEAPHRIRRTLKEVQIYCGNRPILVHRELSKIHEEFVIWDNTVEAAKTLEAGELVVIVGYQGKAHERPEGAVHDIDRDFAMFVHLTLSGSSSPNDIASTVERLSALSPVRLRNHLKKAALAEKRKRLAT